VRVRVRVRDRVRVSDWRDVDAMQDAVEQPEP